MKGCWDPEFEPSIEEIVTGLSDDIIMAFLFIYNLAIGHSNLMYCFTSRIARKSESVGIGINL